MSTAIDSNVLLALWNEDDTLNTQARSALDAALARGSLGSANSPEPENLKDEQELWNLYRDAMQEKGFAVTRGDSR